MSELGNIDLGEIEVEFDDSQEVHRDENREADRHFFRHHQILSLLHSNQCSLARTSLKANKPE